MSKFDIRKLTCKNCNADFDCKVYTSVNVTIDPSLKEELLSGAIYNYTCPKCGHVHTIVTPLIYHDMEKKVMIIADRFEEALLAKSSFGKLGSEFGLYKDYKFYNALSPSELVEYILCLELDLDPYRIQLMKFMIAEMMKSEENLIVESAGFYSTKEGAIFAITVDKNGEKECRSLNFDYDIYNYIESLIHIFDGRNKMIMSYEYLNKLISYDLKGAANAMKTKYNIAICKNQNGNTVLAKVENFLIDKIREGDVVAVKIDGLKGYKVLDIVIMSDYEYPGNIDRIPYVLYVSKPVEVETSRSSNDVISNAVMLNLINSGLTSKVIREMLDQDVIITATNKSQLSFDEILEISKKGVVTADELKMKTILNYVEEDDGRYLSVYLDQDSIKEETTRLIYKFKDVLRILFSQPGNYKGLVINPKNDNVKYSAILLLNRFAQATCAFVNTRDMVLDTFTEDEANYVGKEAIKLLKEKALKSNVYEVRQRLMKVILSKVLEV